MSASTTYTTADAPAVETASLSDEDFDSFLKTEFRLFVDRQHIVKDLQAYADTLADCVEDMQLGALLHEQEKLHRIEDSLRLLVHWMREQIIAEHQAHA